jgi:hypothetical protein
MEQKKFACVLLEILNVKISLTIQIQKENREKLCLNLQIYNCRKITSPPCNPKI